MSRALVILNSRAERERVADWAMRLPAGTRCEFKEAKRSTDQNARMWAMLTEVALQVPYHGIKLAADDYKLIFLDALAREKKEELRMVPNTEGTGFVNLGRSSSDLSKGEMSDLIELIFAFGAKHGVQFQEQEQAA